MKKISACALLLVAVATMAGSMPDATQTLAVQGIPLEFVFRTLQPGEAVLALFRNGESSVKRVAVEIGGRNYALLPSAAGDRAFALIGLDLNLKPEPLAVNIKADLADGTQETIRQELRIEAKEFEKRRFRVDQNMLTPPPQEQVRVKREQDLVAWVYGVVSPEWLGTGSFISPVNHEAYQNFGQQRIYNKSSTSVHTGVDIAVPWGTAVKASNAGRVVLASQLYLSGKTVIIDHGQGVFSLYGHLSKILVKRGDAIKKGAVLGRVGNTGRSTGPHLHWGVRILDSRVDPLSLVALPLE